MSVVWKKKQKLELFCFSLLIFSPNQLTGDAICRSIVRELEEAVSFVWRVNQSKAC